MAAELLADLSRALDNNGNPIPGAFWKFYLHGSSTPQAVYADGGLSTSLGATVEADSAGRFPPIFFDASIIYRGILTDAAGTPLPDMDIDPINAGSGVAADALRADLESDGFDIVGDGSQTLQEALDALAAADAARDAIVQEFNTKDYSPVVIDMHWGVMLGQGWAVGDPGDGASQKGSTISGTLLAGATSITVVSGTNFVDGQLIAYQGSDTQWYTVRVSTKSGTTLTLDRPAPAAAGNGALIGAFFNDHNHPREYGSYAIADYLIRDLASGVKRELCYSQRQYSDWAAWGTATLASYSTLNYENPSSNVTGLLSLKVDSSTQYSGARTVPFMGPAGTYDVEVTINPGDVGGARNTVLVYVEEEFFGTTTHVPTSQSIVGLNGVQKVRIRFAKQKNSRVRLYVQGQVAGTFSFKVGPVRWYKVTGQLADLTAGTWVAFGDSWFANPWILDRIEDRLPDVTLIREGVAGNTSSDLLARFDGDVAAHSPRVVLINCSTNDYAGSVARGTFLSQMREIVRRCQAIGAQPVLFSATVGDAAAVPQLQNSREYAAALEYEDQGEGDQQIQIPAQWGSPITVAAGAKVALLVTPAVNRSVIVDYISWAVSNIGLEIRMGYTSQLTPPAALDNELAFAALSYETESLVVERTPATTTRYFMVVAANTTGAPQTVDRHVITTRIADLLT